MRASRRWDRAPSAPLPSGASRAFATSGRKPALQSPSSRRTRTLRVRVRARCAEPRISVLVVTTMHADRRAQRRTQCRNARAPHETAPRAAARSNTRCAGFVHERMFAFATELRRAQFAARDSAERRAFSRARCTRASRASQIARSPFGHVASTGALHYASILPTGRSQKLGK